MQGHGQLPILELTTYIGTVFKWCQENWTVTCTGIKLEHSLIPYTKVISKWIKDQNVRSYIIKLLEENIGRTLFDVNCRNSFWMYPKVKEITAKINKWN